MTPSGSGLGPGLVLLGVGIFFLCLAIAPRDTKVSTGLVMASVVTFLYGLLAWGFYIIASIGS